MQRRTTNSPSPSPSPTLGGGGGIGSNSSSPSRKTLLGGGSGSGGGADRASSPSATTTEVESLLSPSLSPTTTSGGGDCDGSTLSTNGTTTTTSKMIPMGSTESSSLSSLSSQPSQQPETTSAVKLIFGAGGIYLAFLYYGSLQEDVFAHRSISPNPTLGGPSFKQAWFLQVIESMANVLVGYFGRKYIGGTRNLPQKQFVVSGASQVCAKAFTSLSLANGVSFPVATLAKSAKMAPVMLGSLVLGGASYTAREYFQVTSIICGTALVSMGKKKSTSTSSSNSVTGILFILLSLTMDGITGGIQKKFKSQMLHQRIYPQPYDFMYYTNLYMMVVAFAVSFLTGDFFSGLAYVTINPDVLRLIIKFSICSAVGQSFIFYTIAHFDPLVCSTVTTTRKIFSVLLSIMIKGHVLQTTGWCGLGLAIGGILGEVMEKYQRHNGNGGNSGGGGGVVKKKMSDINGGNGGIATGSTTTVQS